MVKELLKEQKELKYQLDATTQSNQRSQKRPNIYGGPNKKASERVPRQINSNQVQKDPFAGLNLNNDIDLDNPRNHLNVGLSGKPNHGNPKNNIKLLEDKKKMVEARRKQQQDREKEKLDAIENKIENARRRLEEKKKIKSENAKNIVKRRTATSGVQKAHQKNNYMDSDDEAVGYD